ncbi:MAG: hypothetical protein V1668_01785 [Patescibacteria group bacterium]
MTALEKAIIATLSYFDIFDYPLTAMEIWKWLYVGGSQQTTDYGLQQESITDVMRVLETSEWLKSRVGELDGFYFLKGRQQIVDIRQQRYLWAEDKFHRALKIIRWLRWVPFVRMIGVCNTLAYNNSRRGGDIDLFIITGRHRTWQVRFWVNSLLKILKLRPSLGNTQDKICSSFFVDIDHVNLEQLAIRDDIYLPYWVTQVYPVYDEGAYTTFVQSNEWVRLVLPHWLPIEPVGRRQVRAYRWVKRLKELFFFFWPESLFRSWQEKIMPENLRAMANKDTRVVVNDSVLKFHDTDRRQSFLEQWRERKEQVL